MDILERYWMCTPEELHKKTDEIIRLYKEVNDTIASVPLDDVSVNNVMDPYVRVCTDTQIHENCITFLQNVSTDPAVRDASTQADKRISACKVSLSMRKDVYERFDAIRCNSEHMLSEEGKRFVDHVCRDFRRKGLDLSRDKRDELETLFTRQSELGITFSKNLGEDRTVLEFTLDQLKGLPPDFTKGLQCNNGRYTVNLKYPHVIPILKHCSVPETRKTVMSAFFNRCAEDNTAVLEELVDVRARIADTLGYASFSDYQLETRMAKDSSTVMKFLRDTVEKIEPLAKEERRMLLKLKQEDNPSASDLHLYDINYYQTRLEERDYNIDREKVKEYFPIDVVVSSVLQFYQELLGLIFEENTQEAVWHKDVRLFEVKENEVTIGYFYLDLYPREGKFGHAACFVLQGGANVPCKKLPISACVCNLPEPVEGQPGLIPHDQVITFLHELGHVMHEMCSVTEYQMFAGTEVEQDFVETPSQMLENWLWEEASLKRMSGHYLDRSKPIPSVMARQLSKSKRANCAMLTLRQLAFALFDQKIHTLKPGDTIDVTQTFHELFEDVTKVPDLLGTHLPATFGHIASDYCAQYYGYQWSKVYSDDLFQTKFRDNLMCAETGKRYRACILQPGGSRDAMESLEAFLGRPPNHEAYIRTLGLSEDNPQERSPL